MGGPLCGLEIDASGIKTLSRIRMPKCIPIFGFLVLRLCLLVLVVACPFFFGLPFPYHLPTTSSPRATCADLSTRCEGSPFGVAGVCLQFPYMLLTISFLFRFSWFQNGCSGGRGL